MVTFKAEVYAHQKKADGTYNIKIRVTQNKKKRYLSTIYYVRKEDLTRALKIKNQYYVDETDKLIRSYRRICDRLGEKLKQMSVDEIVNSIQNYQGDRFDLDIVWYWREIIKRINGEDGRKGTAQNYRIALNNMIKFVGRDKISIFEITVKFINDWMDWIKKNSIKRKNNNCRAPGIYVGVLRAVFNRARREFNDDESGTINIPFYPFTRVEMPRVKITRKRALSVDQLREMSRLEYQETSILKKSCTYNISKDAFFLSLGLVGMNAVDLFMCTDYQDGRITYQRQKTKSRRADNAEISIKLEPELYPLFDKYRDPTGQRVFKFYRLYSTPSTFTTALNTGLKKIGKDLDIEDLEFYAARHSWATIAANDAGVDKYTVHTALNHVDPSMNVTDIYIKKSWKTIDDANRKVLDLLDLDLSNVDEEPYRIKKLCLSKLPKQK